MPPADETPGGVTKPWWNSEDRTWAADDPTDGACEFPVGESLGAVRLDGAVAGRGRFAYGKGGEILDVDRLELVSAAALDAEAGQETQRRRAATGYVRDHWRDAGAVRWLV